MNAFSTLQPISRNPDKLIATGIAHTVNQLGYDGDRGALRKRILDLLTDAQAPLTETELDAIEDAITSVPGGDLMALVNHRLFYEFDIDKKLRERDFVSLVGSGLAEFETGGMHKHRELMGTSDFVASFAREEKKKKPARITSSDIWKQIQNQQFHAVNAQNRRLFLEACEDGSALTLHEWTNGSDGTVQLRHDPKNNLMGAIDSKEGLLGNKILSGYRPIPSMNMFYGDAWTVACTDNTPQKKLSLVEFDPRGMRLFGGPQWYFSVIEADEIGERRIIRALDGGELFYCVTHDECRDERVIHSGPGRTVTTNEPLRKFDIQGDVVFVAHESSGSCASYIIHSLQTGGYVKIERKNLLSQEETENDIVFTFRQREAFQGAIHLPGKEPVQWELGKDWWAKKSVSLKELKEVWHKAAGKAKERK